MYQRDILSLEAARVIVEAIIKQNEQEKGTPIAAAVVDEHGELIYFARQDGSYPLYVHMAIHKAYTAARMNIDTKMFADYQKQQEREMILWAGSDNKLAAIQGGVVIKKPGADYKNLMSPDKLGGIGVSGHLAADDERLAFVGLKAFQTLYSKEA